ncbi:MAG: glutathione S-transferase N-terminal domain-containing protein [Caulobacterales bacterium]
MIRLYTAKTPNGYKATIALEELALQYSVHHVDISKAERPEDFLAASPNNKIPAIVDESNPADPISIFESGAILVYLAEKTGKLLPPSGRARAETMAWTFWQVGNTGPMLGQLGFFAMRAPEKIPFAIQRYVDESARLLKVMDQRLDANEYLGGADYSIADIMNYTWIAAAQGYLKEQLGAYFQDKPSLNRWLEVVGARPAVKKGLTIPE